MSIKVMGHVWELDLAHNQMLILLALADHADHQGGNIYPSMGLVAWKTGYSPRQVYRVVKELTEAGILIEVNAQPGRPITYRIDLAAGKPKPAYDPRQRTTPDKMSPPTPDKMSYDKMSPLTECHTHPDNMSYPGMTFATFEEVESAGPEQANPDPNRHVNRHVNHDSPLRVTHAAGTPTDEERKPRKPRAKKTEEPTPIEVRQALADACKIDYTNGPKASKLQVNTTASKLWPAAAAKGLTAEQLAERVKRVAKWIRRYQYPWTDNPAQALPPAAIHKHWAAAIEATRPTARYTTDTPPTASQEPSQAAPASPQEPPSRMTRSELQAGIGAALAAARSGQ